MRFTGLALAALTIAAPASAQFVPEPDDSGLFFVTAGGYVPATRLESSFEIEVTGIVARVAVTQRFRNEGRDWVEGVYVFPLPDDAAVDELTLVIGNRRVEGEIQEREQAKRTYEQARDAGQQASLVEQERPNIFTTSVANIAPGEEIAIEIGYLQTAAYEDGQFSLRLPLTLTPRYIPPGSMPDAARVTPPILPLGRAARTGTHRASIELVVDLGLPLAEIASPSHTLETERDGSRYRLTTGESSVPMDRDLVVNWRAADDQSPRIAAFTESFGGDSYALLMFLPPASANLPAPQPREILFVIDTSGSMNGESIRQARSALIAALGRLAPNDRFNIIAFNSNARARYTAPLEATPSTVQAAMQYVAGLQANGGTNISAALDVAFAQPGLDGMLRQIVFMTDGSVGNEAALFTRISNELGAARLFTVGIGTAPNTHFMRKAAEFGRGSFSHVARAEEVEPAMQRLFEKLEQVALTDITLDWSVDVEAYPARVPDLYRGEPVVVAARIDGRRASDLSVLAGGTVGPGTWSQHIEVEPGRSAGIAALWARRKIESLLDLRLDGVNPATIREDVLAVALEHGLLSPYTSLVAVDRTPERTREAWLRREALGNLPPAGADYGRFTRLPATATGSRWYQLLGIVLVALVLGLYGIWRLTRELRR
jgi:Ca-activated chloride channel family protein